MRTSLIKQSLVLAIVLFSHATGCKSPSGGGKKDDNDNTSERMQTPLISIVTPGQLSVGQRIRVVGENFENPEKAEQILFFTGSFVETDTQAEHPVDLQVRAWHHSNTEVSWTMDRNVQFVPSGDRLGRFEGELQVINRGYDGEEQSSDPLPVNFQINPSLIVRQAQPDHDTLIREQPGVRNCDPVVHATQGNIPFAFQVEALGLKPPIRFTWSFGLKDWNISLKHTPTLEPNADKLLGDLQNKGVLEVEEVTTRTNSAIREGAARAGHNSFFALKLVDDAFGGHPLGQGNFATLRTHRPPEDWDSFDSTVSVTAVDSDGQVASITIPIEVYNKATLYYDGSVQLAQRFAPVRVTSECIPGGPTSRQVEYREDTHEEESQDLRFSANAAASLMVSLGISFSSPIYRSLNLTGRFGTDGGASISSSRAKSLDLSGEVLPGSFGAFYRQKSKVYMNGKVTGHGVCGDEVDLGDIVITDWLFAPDLAIGNQCPPPSGLPQAGNFL